MATLTRRRRTVSVRVATVLVTAAWVIAGIATQAVAINGSGLTAAWGGPTVISTNAAPVIEPSESGRPINHG